MPAKKKAVKPAKTTKVPKTTQVPVEATPKKEAASIVALPSLTDLLEAGAHFGHSVKRRNPKMDKYVYATKNGVQILDLVKTRACLEDACSYLAERASVGYVLVLGTKGQAVNIVRNESLRIGTPYIVNRWVGGLFTNWSEVKKRIDKLSDMRIKQEAGDYKKYTKKEQVLLSREIERLDRLFGGVVAMKELPKALFVVDPIREVTAVREALALNIPIVAVADTNCDPTGLTKVIPANDDSLRTVELLVTAVNGAIAQGMKRKPVTST